MASEGEKKRILRFKIWVGFKGLNGRFFGLLVYMKVIL